MTATRDGGTVDATATWYAASLAEGATPAGPVTVLVVTAVALLALGAVFWSFLRRARRDGGEPLAVDRLDAPRLPEPPAPTVLAAEAAERTERAERAERAEKAEQAETDAAIADEISEGGPVDGPEGRA